MSNNKSTPISEDISELILNSTEDISSLLKATGSPNRLKILGYLLKESRNFAFMLSRLKIKRTTLNHHLDMLIETKLIEKEEWGRYKISEFGTKFLRILAESFKQIDSEEQKAHRDLIKEYNQWPSFYREPRMVTENTITSKALYQGGWNSYISSISGALISLNVPYDYVYISGMSGYCFIVNTTGMIKTSSIKELIPNSAWEEIRRGTESFGWKLHYWEQKRKYPGKWNLTEEDFKTSLDVFNNIVKIIDDYDTPVMLFGIHHTGFGIVNGYRNDSYLVSSFLRMEGREEIPVHFDQLKLLDKFSYFYFKNHIERNDVDFEERQSINRAIRFIEGSNFSHEGYLFGSDAYDLWIDSLNDNDPETIDIFGNSVLGQYYYDGKSVAAEYIDRLARKYKGKPQGVYLKNAFQEYRDAKRHLEKFTFLFPYFEPEKSVLSPENRKKGINILADVKNSELKALEFLEKAYNSWQ